MTTFQDPPLQSRRSVRQNERDQSPSAVVPTTGPAPTPAAPEAPGEPLTYATVARPGPMPEYDAPALRSRRTPEPVDAAQPEGAFRPRDFSPEGRRAAPNWAPPQYGGAGAEAPAAAPAATPVPPSVIDAEDAIEHTLTRRELRALRDAHGITAAESTGETVYPTPEPEQAPAEAVAQPPAPAAPVQDAAPAAPGTPLVAPSSRLDSALAEFDQLAAGRPAAVPSDPPAARGRRAAPRVEEAAPQPVAPVREVPVAEAPAVQAAPPAAGPAQVAPEVLGPQPTPHVEAPAAAPDGVAVFDALFSQPVAEQPPTPVAEPAPVAPAPAPEPAPVAQPEVVVAEVVAQPEPSAPVQTTHEQVVEATIVESDPSTATPPTGHWSTQAQLDDETQFGDAPLARNIGSTSGAITTSALVLPSIPSHDFGPLSTGDVMVTGSISLPASLSATGAHPAQLDESDLDHLLDPGDHQVANTDSQPVRAIKAVSTHTSSRGVIQTVKPKGTRGLTALIIAATGMAVLVGALFIVLVVTGQLG